MNKATKNPLLHQLTGERGMLSGFIREYSVDSRVAINHITT